MKVLVVYDSLYGNTEKIAKAIGGAIDNDIPVLPAAQVNPDEIKSLDLFIVGAPTHGGRASEPMQEFLNRLPTGSLNNIKVAAFDTRMTTRLLKIFGYAAGRIANSLKNKGGNLIITPEGFFVTSSKGPLKEGELERAANWAKEIAESKK